MGPDSKKIFKTLNLSRVWLPVALGVGMAFYLFISNDAFTLASISLVSKAKGAYMLLALLAIVVRDLAYIYRIRTLTHQSLSWLSCFYIVVLWEFSSSVTPSVVGGSVVAVFLLSKEGLKLGKALSYVMLTAMFDNLFFIIAAPIGYFSAYESIFSKIATPTMQIGDGLKFIFWLSYALITVYTFNISFALLFKPKFFKWLLLKCTSIGFLKRWHPAAHVHGDEIILASQSLKGNQPSYWFKISLATLFAWSARYVTLNCLIAAYVPLNLMEHIVVFGKHIMLWVIMLISPTPGSSGTAEFFFEQLYQQILGEYTLVTNLSWRVLTYYLYLILGVIFLPRWLKKVSADKQNNKLKL